MQGVIAARLKFAQLLEVVVPRTDWWFQKKQELERSARGPGEARQTKNRQYGSPVGVLAAYTLETVETLLQRTIDDGTGLAPEDSEPPRGAGTCQTLDRFVALSGFILWAVTERRRGTTRATEVGRPDRIHLG